MTDSSAIALLLEAVERYFALMFDSEVSRFDRVFASSAQLHGLRDGELRLIPAQEYKKALASGSSPKSKNAPRLQEIDPACRFRIRDAGQREGAGSN